ncbi:pentapeptide repeat-containing protein [Pantoea sp. paga]|uniref:pentapeptide repeat-containing protein n=1 Tax=Pantoea sp. paga TaxID=2597519 RepID=UPI00117DAB57|nr:pentapeptide repeat-containing protein [Pantoea sp. paga]TSH78708.1 pentapeptide repeat-containing protein [Pantoea sp. paga]
MEIYNKKISNRQISEKKISGMTYSYCTFEKVQLDILDFRECELEQCRFVDCSFRNIKLNFFKLIDCEFENCLLQGVNVSDIMFPCTFSLNKCKLRFIDFIGLRLQKSRFLLSGFNDCLFEETNLRGSDFTGSEFINSEFRRCDLSNCDFSLTEGLDLNHEINKISSVKIPQDAGSLILKRMGIVIT